MKVESWKLILHSSLLILNLKQMAEFDEDFLNEEEDDILSAAPEEHEHWRIDL